MSHKSQEKNLSIRDGCRKIWIKHHGEIPVDANGRKYDIHHIDGDHTNNDISNLIALSIDDHYKVHLEQHDYRACHAIGLRMNTLPSEISAIARQNALDRFSSGTHPFQHLGNREYLKGKNNPMCRPEVAKKQGDTMRGKTKSLVHKSAMSKAAKARCSEKVKCKYCGIEASMMNYRRWHNENCKEKNNVVY